MAHGDHVLDAYTEAACKINAGFNAQDVSAREDRVARGKTGKRGRFVDEHADAVAKRMGKIRAISRICDMTARDGIYLAAGNALAQKIKGGTLCAENRFIYAAHLIVLLRVARVAYRRTRSVAILARLNLLASAPLMKGRA